MSSNYTVVYDANVMYPAPLRSFLMYLAVSGEFRARWTDKIHEEWIENLLKDRPDLSREKIERTRLLMNQHVPGALVTGYEKLIDSIELPDQNDRHVVAAAIRTRAEAIVTFNVKDFPSDKLDEYDITAIHPDDFICDLIDINRGIVIESARRHRAGLKNPAMTATEYLDLLQRQKLPRAVSLIRSFESAI